MMIYILYTTLRDILNYLINFSYEIIKKVISEHSVQQAAVVYILNNVQFNLNNLQRNKEKIELRSQTCRNRL